MTSLPPPQTENFPDDSLEKKVYKIVEGLNEYLPIMNDRNRLGFSLYKYMTGEGDSPEILVKSSKVKVVGISLEDLAAKISGEIEKLKKQE
ncbi:MAG: hypothetical protein ACYCVH_13480 [Ignavibacteriaceae bacterium]